MSGSGSLRGKLHDNTVHLDDLEITFHRTVKVPDNHDSSNLPPDLGKFPLFQVKDYVGTLDAEMAAKGGLFFPMYQREAMWIRFHSKHPYAIKIYVGAVNAVSGEPAIETAATKLRRQTLIQQRLSVQDYVVTPDQLWLDGIATAEGKVRQFVAVTKGSGYSVEAQVTGEDVVCGLQFEVTPLKQQAVKMEIDVRCVGGLWAREDFRLSIVSTDEITALTKQIQERSLCPAERQVLFYRGLRVDDQDTLVSLGIASCGQNIQNLQLVDSERIKNGGGRTNIPSFYIQYVSEENKSSFFLVDFKPSDTMEDIKSKIEAIEGIPCNRQRLFFCGSRCGDEHKTMEVLGFASDALLKLIPYRVKQMGG